jgi:hypothetical protein
MFAVRLGGNDDVGTVPRRPQANGFANAAGGTRNE